MRNPFRRSKAGEVYQGKVLNCNDPARVNWPGPHGCTPEGRIDKDNPLQFDKAAGVWKRVR
jgi:hypothetical protein